MPHKVRLRCRRRPVLAGLCAALALAGCQTAPATPRTAAGEQTMPPTPQEDQVFLALIRGMNDKGQSQAALAFLDDYLKRNPNDIGGLTLRGDALLRTGQIDAAEAVFVDLDRRRVQPAAAFGLGQVRAKVNDWAGASAQFARAAEAAPTDTRILNNYGFALLKLQQYPKAYDVLARAVQLSPDNQQIKTNFVIAALNSGHDREAQATLAAMPAAERDNTLSFARSWKP